MVELKFDEALCAKCPTNDCLVRCQHLNLNRDGARAEIEKIIKGEDSFVLHDCLTCYACEEYCEMGNHPYYLIVERQEERGMLTVPRPIIKQYANATEPVGRAKVGKVTKKACSACFIPSLRSLLTGRLFEDIASSYIFGQEFCCNVYFTHFAKTSLIKERLPKIVENIKNLGIEQLICLHDECYSGFKSLAPAYGIEVPFEVIHFFEYVYHKLKESESQIKPLNIKAVYQRPCSSRLLPERVSKDHFVDDIFALIGVERAEREYDRQNALCCGFFPWLMKGYEIANDVQRRNLDDMVNTGAEYCVFSCPGCYELLADKVAKRGLKPIHIVDLCEIAIGGKPVFHL